MTAGKLSSVLLRDQVFSIDGEVEASLAKWDHELDSQCFLFKIVIGIFFFFKKEKLIQHSYHILGCFLSILELQFQKADHIIDANALYGKNTHVY